MGELESKLGAILSNPQLMQQIAAMAQSIGQSPPAAEETKPPAAETLPDPGLIQNLAGMLQKSSVDANQQALLDALSPFLTQARIGKLERAMRAAKMASFASFFLKSGNQNPFVRR